MTTMKEAQKIVKDFTERNGWSDSPTVDKFDHLHEELIEMSRHLRYKSEDERKKFVGENRDLFTDEMGDLIFAACRLANQLNVDAEEAFNRTARKVAQKYGPGKENKIVRDGPV